MDILKDMMNNPGLHHVAETIIGYMDRKVALNLVENRELLSEEEQKFLMESLKRRMFDEAQQICNKTLGYWSWTDGGNITKSIFQMYPFFIEALQDLKTSETFESFKQMGQILLLLEDVINEDSGFKLECLNRFIDPNDQDAKGPEDMIKILKKGADLYFFLRFLWPLRWVRCWIKHTYLEKYLNPQ